MLFRAYCATCVGLEVIPVVVEISVQQGVGIYLVGLPDSAVKESLLRVTTALQSCDYRVPGWKTVINLAPANIRKEGSGYDVAIAVGLLAASEQIAAPDIQDFLILGELALDGSLRDVPGALPIALKGKEQGFSKCIFPCASALEASEVEGITIYGAANIGEVVDILNGEDYTNSLVVHPKGEHRGEERSCKADFMDVIGQEFAKRGMEIAASGGHNMILCGVPGSGKSFMASCLASILPGMSREESLETSAVYSVAGLLKGRGLIRERPFRTPHNTSSVVAMVGGGPLAYPGEISLAHNGVLYLDEISLFSASTLDLLRQPLEERVISISRAKYKVTYPASFMLVGSMNPCPCGYFGDDSGRCTCTPGMISRYQARISGPLLDRIDLNIKVKPVERDMLVSGVKGERSEYIARRVLKAREIQLERFKGEGIFTNAQMDAAQLSKYCPLGEQERAFMGNIMEKLSLSARGYGRILRIARTIADMEGGKRIDISHISEAVQYRFNDFL